MRDDMETIRAGLSRGVALGRKRGRICPAGQWRRRSRIGTKTGFTALSNFSRSFCLEKIQRFTGWEQLGGESPLLLSKVPVSSSM